MVSLARGAVHVLLTAPANPPAARCPAVLMWRCLWQRPTAAPAPPPPPPSTTTPTRASVCIGRARARTDKARVRALRGVNAPRGVAVAAPRSRGGAEFEAATAREAGRVGLPPPPHVSLPLYLCRSSFYVFVFLSKEKENFRTRHKSDLDFEFVYDFIINLFRI